MEIFIYMTSNGLQQVASVSAEQIKTYKQDPAFALKQARELSQNWEIYQALMATYLLEKDKTDPRKNGLKGRSVTQMPDPSELMKLYFGESVEYFKETFGNQFAFPI